MAIAQVFFPLRKNGCRLRCCGNNEYPFNNAHRCHFRSRRVLKFSKLVARTVIMLVLASPTVTNKPSTGSASIHTNRKSTSHRTNGSNHNNNAVMLFLIIATVPASSRMMLHLSPPPDVHLPEAANQVPSLYSLQWHSGNVHSITALLLGLVT